MDATLASYCQPIEAIDHVGHIAGGACLILGADLILGVLLSRGLTGRGQLLGLAIVAGHFLCARRPMVDRVDGVRSTPIGRSAPR